MPPKKKPRKKTSKTDNNVRKPDNNTRRRTTPVRLSSTSRSTSRNDEKPSGVVTRSRRRNAENKKKEVSFSIPIQSYSSTRDIGFVEDEPETLSILTKTCANSGECMAIGREMDRIRHFFNGFVDFEYAVSTWKFEKHSTNAFIRVIEYNRDDYFAYAILKSARPPYMNRRGMMVETDSLVYEYLCGQFINQYCRKFPCFIETYGLFYYDAIRNWKEMEKDEEYDNNDFRHTLRYQPGVNGYIDYARSCVEGQLASILIQHLNTATSFFNLLENNQHSEKFMNFELPLLLFQIYFPLGILSYNKIYAHNDLHFENVLVYSLPDNNYVNFEYRINSGRTISFRSKYIVKIIDYGRSYFHDRTNNISSVEIKQGLCDIKECDPECGKEKGFHFAGLPFSETEDLLLLKELSKSLRIGGIFQDWLDQYVDEDSPSISKKQKIPAHLYSPTIVHVLRFLTNFLSNPDMNGDLMKENIHMYIGQTNTGKIIIYEDLDRDMIYEEPEEERI